MISISRNTFLRVVVARNLPVVATFSTRSNNNNGGNNNESQSGNARFRAFPWSSAALVGASAIVGFALLGEEKKIALADDKTVDWQALRKDIAAVLQNDKYDDGSYGPVFIRLAWHACGTYDVASKTGGSDGATMRFEPESKHGANAGLHVARGILEAVKQRHPAVSYSDLWQFAAVVAIEEMGGPKIPFRPGRVDKADSKACTPDGRLPDAAQAAQHLRDIFYRMGFNDQEIVALSGAHTLGRCHTDRSGFDGPWTKAPTMFSNSYFVELLEQEWKPRDWKGPKQFADKSGELMMLPSDLALIQDEKFLAWVKKYKADEELFFKDFAAAFQKLQELGVAKLGSPINSASSSKAAAAAAAPAAGAAKPWYQFW